MLYGASCKSHPLSGLNPAFRLLPQISSMLHPFSGFYIWNDINLISTKHQQHKQEFSGCSWFVRPCTGFRSFIRPIDHFLDLLKSLWWLLYGESWKERRRRSGREGEERGKKGGGRHNTRHHQFPPFLLSHNRTENLLSSVLCFLFPPHISFTSLIFGCWHAHTVWMSYWVSLVGISPHFFFFYSCHVLFSIWVYMDANLSLTAGI